MPKVGVLALQGSVEEHLQCLGRVQGITAMPVKTKKELQQIQGIILPGGESTTTAKLLKIFDLMAPLKERILQGMPVWGTCSGMILLAKEIVGESPHLGVMNIAVRRNAYGRQTESFSTEQEISEFGKGKIPLVFIRAPWVERVWDPANILCELNGHIVAVKQKNMLATSFHPEVTQDLSVHQYFCNMVEQFSKGEKHP